MSRAAAAPAWRACAGRALLLASMVALGGCKPGVDPALSGYLQRSELLAQSLRLEEALLEAEKAVRIAPGSAAAHVQLGRVLRRLGDESQAQVSDHRGLFARAEQALETAIRLDPDRSEPRFELAQLLSASGRAQQALALLEPVARDGRPEARFHLAAVHVELGQLERAAELLERGLAERFEDAAAHRTYGVVLSRSGDLQAARRELELAVHFDPRSAASFHQLGLLYVKLGLDDLAAVALARSRELDPGAADGGYALAGVLRRLGNPDAAEDLEAQRQELEQAREEVIRLEELRSRDPAGSVELFTDLAERYLRLGDLRRAAAHAERALLLRPGYARAERTLAELNRRLGFAERALDAASRACAAQPAEPLGFELRGRIELARGDLDAARSDLRRAYALGARSAVLLEELARLALHRGELGEALALAEEGARLRPEYPPLYKIFAEIQLHEGRPADAARTLLTYLLWRPADLEVTDKLIELARASGDPAGVRTLLRRRAVIVGDTRRSEQVPDAR